MKKFIFVLIALIGFGSGANAQDFCDQIGNRIEFYPKKVNEKISFLNGGAVQFAVEGNFMLGTYEIPQSDSSSPKAYLVIEFYDEGKTDKPSFYGKYYRGTTTREGSVRTKAYIAILGVKLEPCKKNE